MRDVSEGQISEFTNIMRASQAAAADGGRLVADPLATRDEQTEFLELMPDATIVRKVDGTILYWNHHAAAVYGWSRAEALGHVSHFLLNTEFPESLEEMDKELLSKGFWEGELVHTTRDGKRLRVSSYWAVQKGTELSNAAVVEVNRL